MLRWKHLLVVAVAATLLSPFAVYADKTEITGSSLVFQHNAVDPPSEDDTPGFDPDGNIAFVYEVSGPFYGTLVTGKKKQELPFSGAGEAVVYVYVPDDDGVYEGGVAATFSGLFTWYTAKGEITGTFEGIEYATGAYPIPTDIFIEFSGGTGKFESAKGTAFAQGFDFPFGGLGEYAGVVAEVVQGALKVKE